MSWYRETGGAGFVMRRMGDGPGGQYTAHRTGRLARGGGGGPPLRAGDPEHCLTHQVPLSASGSHFGSVSAQRGQRAGRAPVSGMTARQRIPKPPTTQTTTSPLPPPFVLADEGGEGAFKGQTLKIKRLGAAKR